MSHIQKHTHTLSNTRNLVEFVDSTPSPNSSIAENHAGFLNFHPSYLTTQTIQTLVYIFQDKHTHTHTHVKTRAHVLSIQTTHINTHAYIRRSKHYTQTSNTPIAESVSQSLVFNHISALSSSSTNSRAIRASRG